MSTEYFTRKIQRRSQTRLICFDEQSAFETPSTDLNTTLLKRFRVEGSNYDEQVLACKLGMAAKRGTDKAQPTVAGVLLGTDRPTQWLRHAHIQAIAYHGNGNSVSQFSESEWH